MNQSNKNSVRYFVAKCASVDNLILARQTNIWGCQDRINSPHPLDVLSSAFIESDVVFIFSVTGGHGWHGYASMVSPPGDSLFEVSSPIDKEPSDSKSRSLSIENQTSGFSELQQPGCIAAQQQGTRLNNSEVGYSGGTENLSGQRKGQWHKFKIKWPEVLPVKFDDRCLPLSTTGNLLCLDGQTSVNNARNMQEMSQESGKVICHLLEEHYNQLLLDQALCEEARLASAPAPFLDPGTDDMRDPQAVWSKLVKKVTMMGRVLLACASGSQRYNLNIPTSDVDMFVVYVADTRDVLGLSPPQQTIKSSDTEEYDYTILELFRFSELLATGDPKCVETLFLHPSSIYSISAEFKLLVDRAHLFLNRDCVDKYVRDAVGSKGCKMLARLTSGGTATQTPMSDKVKKLLYVIVRLLQNAREAASGSVLQVFRPVGCVEREFIMKIRNGKCSLEAAQAEITRLREEIDRHITAVPERSDEVTVTVTRVVEDWLLQIRLENFDSTKCISSITESEQRKTLPLPECTT